MLAVSISSTCKIKKDRRVRLLFLFLFSDNASVSYLLLKGVGRFSRCHWGTGIFCIFQPTVERH
jgi:hypothetical protein